MLVKKITCNGGRPGLSLSLTLKPFQKVPFAYQKSSLCQMPREWKDLYLWQRGQDPITAGEST